MSRKKLTLKLPEELWCRILGQSITEGKSPYRVALELLNQGAGEPVPPEQLHGKPGRPKK